MGKVISLMSLSPDGFTAGPGGATDQIEHPRPYRQTEKMERRKIRRISPEEAQKMLKEEGMDISLEHAEEVLSFLRKMANIVVSNHLNRKNREKDS